MFVAIAGNIGSGKTTLTKLIADRMGYFAELDDSTNNPYIYDFYADMQRWSFHLQIYFLKQRFQRIVELRKLGQNIVQDRTVFEDAFVFAKNLNEMQLLSNIDYKTYIELFDFLSGFIPLPDLVVYLKAPVDVLLQQIEGRGREYEKGIRRDYLFRLNKHYDEWIEQYKGKKLILEVEKYDFSGNVAESGLVLQKIEELVNS